MTFQDTLRANIQQIRSGASLFLIDTCTIKRRIGEQVINGESISIYDDGTVTACRFIVRSGDETKNITSQDQSIAQSIYSGIYKIQLPFDSNVTEGDRILYTDTVSGEVRTFDVFFVPPHHIYTGSYIATIQEVN